MWSPIGTNRKQVAGHLWPGLHQVPKQHQSKSIGVQFRLSWMFLFRLAHSAWFLWVAGWPNNMWHHHVWGTIRGMATQTRAAAANSIEDVFVLRWRRTWVCRLNSGPQGRTEWNETKTWQCCGWSLGAEAASLKDEDGLCCCSSNLCRCSYWMSYEQTFLVVKSVQSNFFWSWFECKISVNINVLVLQVDEWI